MEDNECPECDGSGEVERDDTYVEEGAIVFGSCVLACPHCSEEIRS